MTQQSIAIPPIKRRQESVHYLPVFSLWLFYQKQEQLEHSSPTSFPFMREPVFLASVAETTSYNYIPGIIR